MKNRRHHLSQLLKRWRQAELLEDIKKAPKLIRKAGKHAKKISSDIANKIDNVVNPPINPPPKRPAPERRLRQTLITQIDLASKDGNPDLIADVAIAVFLKYLYEQWKSGDKDLPKVYRALRDCESETAVSGDC